MENNWSVAPSSVLQKPASCCSSSLWTSSQHQVRRTVQQMEETFNRKTTIKTSGSKAEIFEYEEPVSHYGCESFLDFQAEKIYSALGFTAHALNTTSMQQLSRRRRYGTCTRRKKRTWHTGWHVQNGWFNSPAARQLDGGSLTSFSSTSISAKWFKLLLCLL